MLLIARTDSESARLLSSTVDVADHEFVRGTTTRSGLDRHGAGAPGLPLAQVLAEAEARGMSGRDVDKLEVDWAAQHEMCTFHEGAADCCMSAHLKDLTRWASSRRKGHPVLD